MVRFYLCVVFFIIYVVSSNPILTHSSDESAIRFVGHYNPPLLSPAPEPNPDEDSSVLCVDDLGRVGSLDSTCKFVADLNLTSDHYIAGKGNLHVLSGVRLVYAIPGCSIAVNISGNFSMAENSLVIAGSFSLTADNANFEIEWYVGRCGRSRLRTIE